jgi:hypothetical protein
MAASAVETNYFSAGTFHPQTRRLTVNMIPKFAAAACLGVLIISCSVPTPSSPGTGTPTYAYSLDATVDGTAFSSGATVTLTSYPGDTSTCVLDISGTSSALGQSIELTFLCPKKVPGAITLTSNSPYYLVGKYFQGNTSSAISWTSAIFSDSAHGTVNSFDIGPTDTSISADFSYSALGGSGSGSATVKHVTSGTLRKK